MKKIIALVLALLLVFTAVGVCEQTDSMASTLELTNLTISTIQNGRMRSVRLRNMKLTLILGSTEGVPTLQVNFDNGKGQQVDGVVQFEGATLLMSVGGIAGTYSVDLEAIAGEQGEGAQLAMGYGKGLLLAGPHLDVILMALPTTDASGMRTMEMALPNAIYTRIAEAMLSVAEGMESTNEADVSELIEKVDSSSKDAKLILRYKPSTGDIEIAAMQGKNGAQVAATMSLTKQLTPMVNISAIEDRYNLLDLDADTLEQVRSELEIIATKFGLFAGGTGLNRIFR